MNEESNKTVKKRKLKVNLILIIIVIILVGIMAYCIRDIYHELKSDGESSVEVLDTIKGYDYELNENDSAYFKKLFFKLKDVLESETLDEESYASLLSQLFITDFYSLDSAISKNDVGGIQFVYSDYQADFINKAKTSIYMYVENDIYGKREQELPLVTDVEITSIEQDSYEFDNDISDEKAYVVTVSINYEKDLGYPTECTLVLIHNDGKLQVAQMD